MEQYSTEPRLKPNQQYSVVFNVKGEETQLTFASEYSPLFSTAKIVRNDFKKLLTIYSDDEINRFIHDNSKLALEMANPTFTEDEVPYYAKQYVRYKTELDLMTDVLFTLSTEGGAHEKLLGDMKVMKEVRAPYIESMIKLLQQRLLPWEIQLGGLRASPQSGVRSGAVAEYPLNPRVF